LAPPHRKIVLPLADFPEHAKWIEDIARQATESMKGVKTVRGPLVFPLGSVETTRWAFSPTEPLLLRAGNARYRKLNQPWETGRFEYGRSVLELWNYETGKRLAILGEYGECFQFSPDGRRFALSRTGIIARVNGSLVGQLEIWDTAACKVVRVLRAQASDQVHFGLDGQRLLAVNAGERAVLYDVDTGREVQSWKVERGHWQAVALNGKATMVASGGADRMIHLWDPATGRELARWQGHDGGVTALLFSHDGQTLSSGGEDGTLKLWDLPIIRKELKELGLDW
jgi:WD40 repeat protein